MREVQCQVLLQAPVTIVFTYKAFSPLGPPFLSDKSEPPLWDGEVSGEGLAYEKSRFGVCEITSCTR